MNKKVIVGFALCLFRISFVSAYYYGEGIGDLFDAIGWDNLFLGGVFIVCFALIYWALRFMKNNSIAGIISLVVSLFITYGAHRYGFGLENIIYGIGLPSELYIFLPLIILGGAIFLSFKLTKPESQWRGFPIFFFLLGIGLIFFGVLEFVYEKTFAILVGIGFLILGLIWGGVRKKSGEN